MWIPQTKIYLVVCFILLTCTTANRSFERYWNSLLKYISNGLPDKVKLMVRNTCVMQLNIPLKIVKQRER